MKKDVDRWTAFMACVGLFVALLIAGDYSGAVALVAGLALGVANAVFFRELLRKLTGR